ncbi:hypothetical protein FGO68_gene1127 [Halteria grandinella]|uniref:RING-type domain-containing protein n=1 Tax=Halteria grandinella TaxID=5974 RepID=A0A8J8NL08_HALGN|nr:hypothetical protein FGO68_gene1127 [Halteria grandinella]
MSAYLMTYFFSSIITSFVITFTQQETLHCKKRMFLWLQVSSIFYLIACLISGALILRMRRVGMDYSIVDLGWFQCLFIIYQGNLPHIVLSFIDAAHLVLTILGSKEFFPDLQNLLMCYYEIPVLANIMFILLLLGYMYIIRWLVSIFHFKFGPVIWYWIRTRCPCFRRFDPVPMSVKLPGYTFGEYSTLIKSERKSLGSDPHCPICCESFLEKPEEIIVPLQCSVKHAYHEACISLWLSKHMECPMCKARVFQ